MLQKFKTYYQKNDLFSSSDKILLAVSGGKDSMAMIHLFRDCNLTFGVAHCNFSLRGAESDADEELVKSVCEKHNIPFHQTTFNTNNYAEQNGISIQMAARELRYDWFEKIREENGYDYVATAHHKNDVAETMLINLIKGTGLSGLHGIRNKKDKIVRPILCFTRQEINQFILEEQIDFREDKSNSEVKYTRNRIRHSVIPEMEAINPSVVETLNVEAEQFLELEKILHDKIEDEKKRLFRDERGMISISIYELKKLNPLTSYLYLLLKDYGFNKSDITDVIHSMDGESGKRFYSSTHELTKDRDVFLLQDRQNVESEKFIINELADIEKLPISFSYSLKNYDSDIEIQKSKDFAYLDIEKIQFPLIMRKWRKGDTFQPYGMKGRKKLSDYWIDNKVPLPEKKEKWVLEANGKIIWLVGERIDDNYKLTNQSNKVLLLQLLS
ncbi:MAG: tRNA lysidine(34) synthetase TilS [Vicingus serpentipes]|nr:tRNA lysidine(34) synthetase TilS [Vicingus serpentipes]